ncbi:hypothetical protein [Sulfitobacter sp.]|uniref:hypothetical protein n=1 Tax=Sulfitobacter sp. TaxID=1903071 RepID=UPI003299BFE7
MLDRLTGDDGFLVFDHDPHVEAWAREAHRIACSVALEPNKCGPENLRHQRTWFVGVDALPNGPDGSIGNVPLVGPWQGQLPDLPLHPAQLSIIYPGYPKRDSDESEANHRYRITRSAAHVDGLLPTGALRRRFAMEYHAYILSIPLNAVPRSPTVVWRGSQKIMQSALQEAIGSRVPAKVDITQAYQEARRKVFETCPQVPLELEVGQSAVLHPFILHGTQPWGPESRAPEKDATQEGRMIAFFRPECAGGAAEWLSL